jgi:5-methylcytosine-specific restriction endonuclease McrA
LKNIKRYSHNYKIIKEYSIEQIFNIINNNSDLPDKVFYSKVDYDDSLRRVKIMKNLIERDKCECKKCREIPSYFALGKDRNGYFHLDLYSKKDGVALMYTIDHIYPKSKGGKDDIENYQLLCKVCNEDKSDKIEGEDELIINKKLLNYLPNKLNVLSVQIYSMLNKLKRKSLINIKKENYFTINKKYKIQDILLEVDNNFEVIYHFYLMNDDSELVEINITNFITMSDFNHR